MSNKTQDMKREVERIADTAKIGLAEGEWQLFVSDLELIQRCIDHLSGLSLDDVERTIYSTPSHQVMRKDVVQPSLPKELALRNAPKVEDGCYWVPRILEG